MIIEESNPEPVNPLGMDGIEFIEYTTSQPQAFGALLQKMGFARWRATARAKCCSTARAAMNLDRQLALRDAPAAPDAGAMAFGCAMPGRPSSSRVELGAWEMPTRAAAMELHIPGIRGVGESHIYFVDRHGDFSIYDVDFAPLAGADPNPPALAGLHWFGVVQAILGERTRDGWSSTSHCSASPCCRRGRIFGVVRKGVLLESPCRKFYLQLIEPPAGRRGHPLGGGPGAHRARHARRPGGDARADRRAASSSSTAARFSRPTGAP